MRIFFFFVAAVAIVGIAWNISRDQAPSTEISTDSLFPELLESVNDIDRISIVSAAEAIDLARLSNGWVVSNRDNFPADIAKVRSTLLALSETTVLESKTAKPENYEKIGVNTPETSGSDSQLIDVFAGQDTKLVSLIVGNKRSASQPGSPQYFVREADSQTALLVQGNLEVNADPTQWIETDIVDIAADRVKRVTIGTNKVTPIVVSKEKSEENFYTLENIPEGFVPTSRSVVSSFGALLLGVRFDNVFSGDKITDQTVRSTSVLETFDGLRATIEQFDFEDMVVSRFRFTYDAELVESIDQASEVTTDTAPTDPAPEPKPSVESTVDVLNEKVKKWLYVLPDYKNRLLAKNFDEMIKPEELPEANGDEASTAE